LLSQTSIHVIRALTYLAAQPADEYVGAAVIATETGAPQNYLGKLLKQLCQSGLLQSRRGAGGGVRLAQAAENITLLQIVEPVEHLTRRQTCFMGDLCCGKQPCAYHKSWLKLHSDLVRFLDSVTLAGLAQQSNWQNLPQVLKNRPGGKSNADSIKHR